MDKVVYFSVFDAVARRYGPLFPAVNDGVAKRMFKKLLADVEPDEFANFRLCKLFHFDSVTADIEDLSLVVICDGTYFEKEHVK